MNWDTIQQVLRIVLYAGGGLVFGDAVKDGELFQQAVGGLMSVGAFVWWYVWERKRA